MTDITQTTGSDNRDLLAREEAIVACISENGGILKKSLRSLPAPVLVLVKGVVNVLLIPLHLLASLPLVKIYDSLKSFVKDEIEGDCLPLSSDLQNQK